jgi:hypothetical protein
MPNNLQYAHQATILEKFKRPIAPTQGKPYLTYFHLYEFDYIRVLIDDQIYWTL